MFIAWRNKLMSQRPLPRTTLASTIVRPSREESENRPDELLWLDKNENSDPIYINIIKELLTDLPAKALFGYPDCHALYQKLACYLDQPIKHLMVAGGSDGVIRAVHETFIAPGDKIIYTMPTFAMYSLYAQIYGAQAIELHYRPSPQGPVLAAETIIQAIHQEQPKLVCIPNPNSPTGTVFSPEELIAIMDVTHAIGAVLLIDEAYHPFYSKTVIDMVHRYPHLIVARTFSKGWGCAGIRIGYGIACKQLTSELQKVRPMYEAGALSIILAERILDYAEEMLASVERLNQGKKYFVNEMAKLKCKTFPTEGNFLHVHFDKHASAIHEVLKNKMLYRKDFAHESLRGFSRLTTTIEDIFVPIVQEIKQIIIA
jgi:histidinol-phosphate aminotransferase